MDCRGPSYYGKHGISRVSERNIELAYLFRAKSEGKNGRFFTIPEIRAVRFGVLGGRIKECTLNTPSKVGIHSLGLFGG